MAGGLEARVVASRRGCLRSGGLEAQGAGSLEARGQGCLGAGDLEARGRGGGVPWGGRP
ncbi:hypothetical protein KY285_000817 [Solanum tuberosum]|nr:hypothetical protein KY289_001003 [Solanum tuberosum]KAH0764946.1 hypothetical protein KY285_000817 [Solanum tuberosum]